MVNGSIFFHSSFLSNSPALALSLSLTSYLSSGLFYIWNVSIRLCRARLIRVFYVSLNFIRMFAEIVFSSYCTAHAYKKTNEKCSWLLHQFKYYYVEQWANRSWHRNYIRISTEFEILMCGCVCCSQGAPIFQSHKPTALRGGKHNPWSCLGHYWWRFLYRSRWLCFPPLSTAVLRLWDIVAPWLFVSFLQ